MLIVLNHKMNFNIDEIREYEKGLRDYQVIVMPQIPYMGLFSKGKYILGSQCVSEYNATGGVSAESLTGLNVKYVMVGHAERRAVRKETEEAFARKINSVIEHNMTPIYCLGESLEEKEAGFKYALIDKQLADLYIRLTVPFENIIIAYEPVWSIGAGESPDMSEIEDTLLYIRKQLKEKYNSNNPLLYGGSVCSNNILQIKNLNIVDGVIVGSASLKLDEVIKIYNLVNEKGE
jgi:triosephosphate isomerase